MSGLSSNHSPSASYRGSTLAAPQQWALDAGLPEPEEGEPWIPYLFRLGLLDTEIEELMVDLTDRTIDVLPYRFTDYLRKNGFAWHWNEHVRKRVEACLSPKRIQELEEIRYSRNRHHVW